MIVRPKLVSHPTVYHSYMTFDPSLYIVYVSVAQGIQGNNIDVVAGLETVSKAVFMKCIEGTIHFFVEGKVERIAGRCEPITICRNIKTSNELKRGSR